ncbi:MAG: glycosyltransferase family 2 protein [Clostridia bacterium]|nr:glycosyltransferase family 2 protein [Clostridia bacterium]
MPKISVIMSTYNTPNDWLYDSIMSILNQTYGDFEFLIADDCSTTNVEEVKTNIQDKRVIWIKNEENLGLTKTLNKLLRMCNGEYIARMDSDDISLPNRFEEQIKYMEKNPKTIACGCYRRAFGLVEQDEKWNLSSSRAQQQVDLFFTNRAPTHPSAIFRKSMFDKYGITYNENYTKAQDYGIWVQCSRYGFIKMIPQVLLKYRKSKEQISIKGKVNQGDNARKVRHDQVKSLGIEPTELEWAIHDDYCKQQVQCSAQEFETWIEKLLKANQERKYFAVKHFKRSVLYRAYRIAYKKYREEKDYSFHCIYKKYFSISRELKRRLRG